MKTILVLFGLALIGGGCAWHYPPLALVTVGSVLFAAGVLSHFYTARRPAE